MALYLGLSLQKRTQASPVPFPAKKNSTMTEGQCRSHGLSLILGLMPTQTLCLKRGIRFLDFKVMASRQFRLLWGFFSIVLPAKKTDNALYILCNLC